MCFRRRWRGRGTVLRMVSWIPAIFSESAEARREMSREASNSNWARVSFLASGRRELMRSRRATLAQRVRSGLTVMSRPKPSGRGLLTRSRTTSYSSRRTQSAICSRSASVRPAREGWDCGFLIRFLVGLVVKVGHCNKLRGSEGAKAEQTTEAWSCKAATKECLKNPRKHERFLPVVVRSTRMALNRQRRKRRGAGQRRNHEWTQSTRMGSEQERREEKEL